MMATVKFYLWYRMIFYPLLGLERSTWDTEKLPMRNKKRGPWYETVAHGISSDTQASQSEASFLCYAHTF